MIHVCFVYMYVIMLCFFNYQDKDMCNVPYSVVQDIYIHVTIYNVILANFNLSDTH